MVLTTVFSKKENPFKSITYASKQNIHELYMNCTKNPGYSPCMVHVWFKYSSSTIHVQFMYSSNKVLVQFNQFAVQRTTEQQIADIASSCAVLSTQNQGRPQNFNISFVTHTDYNDNNNNQKKEEKTLSHSRKLLLK